MTDTPWKFLSENDDLDSKIMQAMGGASACWESLTGAGVFQSERCQQIGELLQSEVRNEIAKINGEAEELLELAWGIIANAGYGDWKTQSPDWQTAAARWRDRYHQTRRVAEYVHVETPV